MQWHFQHIVAALDDPGFLAFGQQRAVPGRGIERTDSGAGRTDAFGQVALGYHLQLHFPGPVQLVKHIGVGLARERANHLGDPSGLEQCGQADFTVAGVVTDDGQVASARGNDPVHQFRRHAGSAEATHHDDRAIGNSIQCGSDGFEGFVDQGVLLFLV